MRKLLFTRFQKLHIVQAFERRFSLFTNRTMCSRRWKCCIRSVLSVISFIDIICLMREIQIRMFGVWSKERTKINMNQLWTSFKRLCHVPFLSRQITFLNRIFSLPFGSSLCTIVRLKFAFTTAAGEWKVSSQLNIPWNRSLDHHNLRTNEFKFSRVLSVALEWNWARHSTTTA